MMRTCLCSHCCHPAVECSGRSADPAFDRQRVNRNEPGYGLFPQVRPYCVHGGQIFSYLFRCFDSAAIKKRCAQKIDYPCAESLLLYNRRLYHGNLLGAVFNLFCGILADWYNVEGEKFTTKARKRENMEKYFVLFIFRVFVVLVSSPASF